MTAWAGRPSAGNETSELHRSGSPRYYDVLSSFNCAPFKRTDAIMWRDTGSRRSHLGEIYCRRAPGIILSNTRFPSGCTEKVRPGNSATMVMRVTVHVPLAVIATQLVDSGPARHRTRITAGPVLTGPMNTVACALPFAGTVTLICANPCALTMLKVTSVSTTG